MHDFYLAKNIKPEARARIVGNAVSLIDKLNYEQRWKISVGLDKDTRSMRQHRYYFSGVLGTICRHYDETMGLYQSTEIWHQYFKARYLSPQIINVKGDDVKIYKSTTKLSKKEFSDYIEKIACEVAQDGCVIPEPTSDMGLD